MVSRARRPLSLLLRRRPTPAAPATAKPLLLAEHGPDNAVSFFTSITGPSAFNIYVPGLPKPERFHETDSPAASKARLLASHIFAFAFGDTRMSPLLLAFIAAGIIPQVSRFNESEIPAPNVVSFNALLTACLRANLPSSVPHLFADLSTKYSLVPNAVSYDILIKSLCITGHLAKALKTLNGMKEKKIEISINAYTGLLYLLYKKGKSEEAEKLWNMKVNHHAIRGEVDEVLEAFKELECVGLEPYIITYNSLMTAYGKNGRFQDAKGVYEGLKKKGPSPNSTTFKIFLCLCIQNGELDLGMEIYRQIMMKDEIPEFRMMSFFLEELVERSRVDEARAVANEVKERFPESLAAEWVKLEKKLGLSS